MKVLQFPLTKITIAFVIGILATFFVQPEFHLTLTFVLVSFIAFATSFYFSRQANKQQSHFGLTVYMLSFFIGAATLQIHSGFFQKNHYIHQIPTENNSHLIQIVLRERLKSSAKNDRFFALVQKVDGKETSGKILVNLDKKQFLTLPIGVELTISGIVSKNKKPYNPEQFDYGQYLTNKSVLAQLYANKENTILSKNIHKDFFYYADRLRNHILQNLSRKVSAETLPLIAALILGQQQDISAGVLHDYQFAGAVHILSVSGLHVGFIMLFMTFLLNFVPNKKWVPYFKLFAVVLTLWGFAFIAGLSPSVIRSVTMFSFVAIGLHLKRKTNIFHTLLVSVLLILLVEPSFLFDVGFQLSYVALFFILWLQPIFSVFWQPENKIARYFWDILTVSFAAQIGTFPLSVYYFHQFPGLFFLTNLIIIPFLSLIMALGVTATILATFNFVPSILANFLEYSIVCLNKIIHKIASFDTFVIQDIPFNQWLLLTVYLFIFSFLIWVKKPNFNKMILAICAFFLVQLSFFGSHYMHSQQKEWIVFNAKKASLIAEREGKEITILSDGSLTGNNAVKAYAVANFCKIKSQKPIKNMAYFNSKKILIIDSLSQYPKKVSPDVIVLRQSPKINLERLLQTCNPKIIVADASNYKSYVALWKMTCSQQKIPFHAVAEKGFFKMN